MGSLALSGLRFRVALASSRRRSAAAFSSLIARLCSSTVDAAACGATSPSAHGYSSPSTPDLLAVLSAALFSRLFLISAGMRFRITPTMLWSLSLPFT